MRLKPSTFSGSFSRVRDASIDAQNKTTSRELLQLSERVSERVGTFARCWIHAQQECDPPRPQASWPDRMGNRGQGRGFRE